MTNHENHIDENRPSWNKVTLLALTFILTLIAWACTQCVTAVTRIELVGFDPSETYFQHEDVPLDHVSLRITFDDQSEYQKYLSDPAIVVRGSILPDLSLDTDVIGEDFVVHIYYAGFSYHIHYDVIELGTVVKSGESIQAAIDASEPGDMILVEAGVYEETLVIPEDKTGITLRAISGAEETVVKNMNAEAVPTTLKIEANDVTVEGFTFTKYENKSHQDEVGILLKGVEGVLVSQNVFSHKLEEINLGTAIHFYGSTNNVVKDNIISYFEQGITIRYSSVFGHSSYNEIVENQIIDCVVGVGIFSTSSTEHGFMQGNILSKNIIRSADISDSFGIKLIGSGHIHNFVIEANTIDGFNTGISFREMGAFTFSNNSFTNNALIDTVSVGFDFHSLRGDDNRFDENSIDGENIITLVGMRFDDVAGLNNSVNHNLLKNTVNGVELYAAFNLEEGEFSYNKFFDILENYLTINHVIYTLNLDVNANYNYWGGIENPLDKINVNNGILVLDTWYIDEDLTTTNHD